MPMPFDFDGEKYQQASKHQKEWGNKIISELALTGNERILDLGCGDGVLTRQLAGIVPRGYVLGLDGSPGMIETAGHHTNDNLSFVCMDINDLDFSNEFDFIFSNAALHWVKDHENLLKNCKRALRENGRIRWSFGGFGNSLNLCGILEAAIKSPEYKDLFDGFEWPWYMPNTETYTRLVKNAGYSKYEITLENADRHFTSGDELIKWIDQPCIVPFLDYINEQKTKVKFRDTVITDMLAKTLCGDGTYFETFRRLNVKVAIR